MQSDYFLDPLGKVRTRRRLSGWSGWPVYPAERLAALPLFALRVYPSLADIPDTPERSLSPLLSQDPELLPQMYQYVIGSTVPKVVVVCSDYLAR